MAAQLAKDKVNYPRSKLRTAFNRITQGNAAFKAANYDEALAHYSTAMQLDPSQYTFPLNRCMTYLKMSRSECSLLGLEDALTSYGRRQVERSRKGCDQSIASRAKQRQSAVQKRISKERAGKGGCCANRWAKSDLGNQHRELKNWLSRF